MTKIKQITKHNDKIRNWINILVFIFLSCILVVMSKEISKSVSDGIRLAVFTVISSLFPFFILADFFTSSVEINSEGTVSKIFKALFGISGAGAGAFLCGIICGFPLGVKYASNLYKQNIITEEELRHLAGISNNPSLAFVISAVGLGMLGSLKWGLVLYASVIISAITVGILFRAKQNISSYSSVILRQKFDLISSIKNAGVSSLTISSYIVFFCALLGVVSAISDNAIFTAIISCFLEIGNASNIIIKSAHLTSRLKLILLGFALGFSGFSVHLQGFAFLPENFGKCEYIFKKLIQGLICSATVFVFVALAEKFNGL